MWEVMTTTISVGKDMKTLTLDELIGALRVHEVHLCKNDKIKVQEPIALLAEEDQTKSESTKAERKKGKTLKVEQESSSEASSEDSSEDEVSFMAKKFRRMTKKKGRSNRLFRTEKKKD